MQAEGWQHRQGGWQSFNPWRCTDKSPRVFHFYPSHQLSGPWVMSSPGSSLRPLDIMSKRGISESPGQRIEWESAAWGARWMFRGRSPADPRHSYPALGESGIWRAGARVWMLGPWARMLRHTRTLCPLLSREWHWALNSCVFYMDFQPNKQWETDLLMLGSWT